MDTINTGDKLHIYLETLINKYKQNDYLYGRLCNYMEKILPMALDNYDSLYKQREERKKQLTSDKDEFINRFLQKNNYFYSPQSELFLHYDGTHFKIYSEDNIQHQILSTITSEQSLMDWKHKTNNNLLKRIKEKSPLTAIPESSTIQYVINSLYPLFFSTRDQAKYFLTIIGDNLMSKQANTTVSINSSLIYIISPVFKELLREISNQCYSFFGISSILNNIKFKYYDHNYNDSRLVQFNLELKKSNIPNNLIKNMIDLLCVASHYSQRYGSADGFLQTCADTALIEHALFLKQNTTENIVDHFLENTITPLATARINSKNMIFLWKKYLDMKNIPNIIFYTAFKKILKEKYLYDEETDSFLDITSTQLPIVSKFIKFWEATITEDDETEDNELEIDEILTLFKQWSNNGKTSINMNETLLIDLIQHFYPDINVIDNKFVKYIKSSSWDKRSEVITYLELFKMNCSVVEEGSTKSLNEAYEYYTLSKNTLNVSKNYFERVSIELINLHIDKDGLIKSSWWKE